MIIDYAGERYAFELDDITIDELREFKRKYKFSARTFQEGVNDGDPDAMTCAYWAMLRQNGQAGSRALNDDLVFAAVPFIKAVHAAIDEENKREEAEAAAAAAAEADGADEDPTQQPPGSPPSAEPSTRTAGTSSRSRAASAGTGSSTGT